jgi:hypothetical protein
VIDLRRKLVRLMVDVNLVPLDLAEEWVREFSDQEVSFRLQVFARDGFFAGMELSEARA